MRDLIAYFLFYVNLFACLTVPLQVHLKKKHEQKKQGLITNGISKTRRLELANDTNQTHKVRNR